MKILDKELFRPWDGKVMEIFPSCREDRNAGKLYELSLHGFQIESFVNGLKIGNSGYNCGVFNQKLKYSKWGLIIESIYKIGVVCHS